ncbi:hypothetical protein FIBSPDRAFT_763598 [Athelia psychrophila]|uniref:Integrase core domain-containing protein n=1 Tax=Athelia psychrophila TaxID=1759441 RepID=A0A167X8B2_9AGAM|nr:hypothetical protein FIBSPDRAFT_763598 [Fibularhizoctonia sp. CBS 109695]
MWVKVGTQFARRWWAFFTRLEHLHYLDADNPTHLWLLLNLFLNNLNDNCKAFQQHWNNHLMGGSTTNDKSPLDQCFLGQARLGVYKDECASIHPDIISTYYGVHCKIINCGPDLADEINEDVADHIAADQQTHVCHEAIKVPVYGNPFMDEATEAKFWQLLAQMVEGDIVPEDVGLHSHKWNDRQYPLFEVLRVGNRGTKEVQISLEEAVWQQRAKLWGQAMTALEVVLTSI